jgi:hypothetical protein
MGWSHGTVWDSARVESELRRVTDEMGRMPTVGELTTRKQGDLANAVVRSGGFAEWAKKLGVARKGTETHRGQDVELAAIESLRREGFDVQRQPTRAPFDLLVNGRVRVDVKSGKFADYSTTRRSGRGRTDRVAGHFFGINHRAGACDLYLLCGVDESNRVLWRYFVPASDAQVGTLTLTPKGKYSRFKESVNVLRDMCLAA